jgi:hypothetical protein
MYVTQSIYTFYDSLHIYKISISHTCRLSSREKRLNAVGLNFPPAYGNRNHGENRINLLSNNDVMVYVTNWL